MEYEWQDTFRREKRFSNYMVLHIEAGGQWCNFFGIWGLCWANLSIINRLRWSWAMFERQVSGKLSRDLNWRHHWLLHHITALQHHTQHTLDSPKDKPRLLPQKYWKIQKILKNIMKNSVHKTERYCTT